MKTIALIKRAGVVIIVIALSLMSLGKVTKQHYNQWHIFSAAFEQPEAYAALHIAYLDR